MFNALLETRNAAGVTVVVFIGTFLIALAIGRLLKRRAGVRLGLLFRLFCLALAFYAAMWAYGVPLQLRTLIGSAAALLITAFFVGLVYCFVWYFFLVSNRQ